MTALNIKMSKELIKQRIEEALNGDPAQARQRIDVCFWGLEHAKNGPALVNELIDELGLQAHGQSKRMVA